MKLTESQIDNLYKFTRQHYVYHHDVQTELVDHMANDIEQIWLEYPKITFEEARDKSFKKFGIFGFMDVIEAKQKQMNKRYWKLLLRFAKEWFTLPKLITTLLIFFGVLFLIQIPFAEIAIVSVLLILVVFEMIAVYKIRKEHKAKEKTDEKIFLLEAMIGTTKNSFTGFTFINLFNFINLTKFDFSGLNMYWLVFIALTVTVLVIFFYVANYVLPQKAEELLQETYPEYKMVKNL
ncbi:MAG: hypothetical protein ABF311_00565 [Polaribacter sp.]|jgi:ABC-type multidrug transport system fused ATPase/permease subunit